jgi:hypothetical protein
MQTYRVTTQDGRKHQIHATSAAVAIEECRWMFRGKKVIGCYSGLKKPDVDQIRMMDRDARPLEGYIEHEVPPNTPIPPETVREVRSRSKDDETVPMFNEVEIEKESVKAKDKFSID